MIHFVGWTEIKANKRQHLMFHIHVLVVSLSGCWVLFYLMLSSVVAVVSVSIDHPLEYDSIRTVEQSILLHLYAAGRMNLLISLLTLI